MPEIALKEMKKELEPLSAKEKLVRVLGIAAITTACTTQARPIDSETPTPRPSPTPTTEFTPTPELTPEATPTTPASFVPAELLPAGASVEAVEAREIEGFWVLATETKDSVAKALNEEGEQVAWLLSHPTFILSAEGPILPEIKNGLVFYGEDAVYLPWIGPNPDNPDLIPYPVLDSELALRVVWVDPENGEVVGEPEGRFFALGEGQTAQMNFEGGYATIAGEVYPIWGEPEAQPQPTPEVTRGYKEEHSAEVLGFTVRYTLELDPSVMERQTRPVSRVYLNTIDFPDAEQRVAEAIMRAHWHAWQADNPGERNGVSFEDFMTRLKNGEDLTYYIAAIPYGATSVIPQNHVPINPAARTEISWTWPTGPVWGVGWFRQTSNGGIRLEMHDNTLSPSETSLEEWRREYPEASNEEIIRGVLSSIAVGGANHALNALSWQEVYQLGQDPPLPLNLFGDILELLETYRGEPPSSPILLEKTI